RPQGNRNNLLALEEIFECLPRIHRPGRRWSFHGNLGWLHIGGWCGIFLHRHAKLIEFAIVLAVLRRDTRGDDLRAFKLRSRIEEAALFTAMKLRIALWTLAARIKAG